MSAPSRCLGAAGALVADAALPEPPDDRHPVAVFGRAMTALEDRMWSASRARGAAYTAVGLGAGLAAGKLVRSTAVAGWIAVARRNLAESALAIHRPLELGDLDAARDLLPTLVGRDPTGLDATAIARAVVESVAENSVDAVIAPTVWAAVAGAPGALAYRAVNTMDAMVGHHSERHEEFGWASARLDDLANWVPARLGVALAVAARPRRGLDIVRTVGRDAPAHPSPNAGPIEAAFAAALGVQLGGTNAYGDRVEHRGTLGDGATPNPDSILEAVALMDHMTFLLGTLLAGQGHQGSTTMIDVRRLAATYDAVLFDIGGTLVSEAPPATPTSELVVEPLPGAIDTVAALAGRTRVGAVTNTAVMTEADVRALLEPCGLSALLEVVVTSFDVGVAKPDPRPLLVAMDRLGLDDPARVLYVGNAATDEQAARSAGMAYVDVGTSVASHGVRSAITDAGAATSWRRLTGGAGTGSIGLAGLSGSEISDSLAGARGRTSASTNASFSNTFGASTNGYRSPEPIERFTALRA